MFVVWGDVADRFVQPDRVVVDADAVEFGFEQGRIGDVEQVGPFVLDVPEERLDPGLVGGRVGPAVVLGDGHHGHVGAGVN